MKMSSFDKNVEAVRRKAIKDLHTDTLLELYKFAEHCKNKREKKLEVVRCAVLTELELRGIID